jgi:hypothetical protein
VTGVLGEFGGELGRNLADKWLNLLALPGALFLASCVTARVLGQAHALDAFRMVRQVSGWGHNPAVTTVGGEIVLLAAVLAASVAVGLTARALGSAIERAVLAADWRSWPRPARAVARHLTQARRDQWDAAHRNYSAQWEDAARALALNRRPDPTGRHGTLRARTAIGVECPDRPTWSGDRIHAISVRLLRDHRLDPALIWPHLWLTLPDQERAEITAARTALTRATELFAWAVLYAALACFWWPASIIAVLLALSAHRRIRGATDDYARLVEAAIRLHARDLTQRLGIECPGPLPADIGDQLGELLGSAPPVAADSGQGQPHASDATPSARGRASR